MISGLSCSDTLHYNTQTADYIYVCVCVLFNVTLKLCAKCNKLHKTRKEANQCVDGSLYVIRFM